MRHGWKSRRQRSDLPPPLLIIAGAGSGKTNTLAHRVAHLLVGGADPRRILLMTFSRRAATELARRVGRITSEAMGTGYAAEALTWAGTFHGIGARLLREHAMEIGLNPDFSIHDREDSADLMNLVRHGLGFSKTEARFPAKGTCLAIYSRAVNAEEPLAQVLRNQFPWCANWEAELKQLFGAYVAAKQAQNVLDYDDLLLAWAQVMEDPGFAAHIGATWDHVMIDEYQDTNRLQSRILLALKPNGHGLTVVGDDAQSIYAFRAATVRNILEFPQAFTPPAEVITLDRNYRSTQPILAAANAVIEEARERFTKSLWTERQSPEKPRLVTLLNETDQARYFVDQILLNRETGMRLPLKDDDYLILSTIHSAKGQEWRSVFLLNVVDGCIPSDLGTGTTSETEEERRLLYVAMTRAKDQLTLGVPLRFYVTQQTRNGDRHLHAMRSRFIPREMLVHFDVIHWSPPILVDGSVRPPAPQSIDVAAKMRGMWG